MFSYSVLSIFPSFLFFFCVCVCVYIVIFSIIFFLKMLGYGLPATCICCNPIHNSVHRRIFPSSWYQSCSYSAPLVFYVICHFLFIVVFCSTSFLHSPSLPPSFFVGILCILKESLFLFYLLPLFRIGPHCHSCSLQPHPSFSIYSSEILKLSTFSFNHGLYTAGLPIILRA